MQCTRKFEILIVNEKQNHGICNFTKNVEKKRKSKNQCIQTNTKE